MIWFDGLEMPTELAISIYKAKESDLPNDKQLEGFLIDLNLCFIPFIEYVKSIWDKVEPLNANDVMLMNNAEHRVVAMKYLSFEELCKALPNKLIDKALVDKVKTHIVDDKEVITNYSDTYELYKFTIEYNVRFRGGKDFKDIYKVRCWCTTTNREYLINPNQAIAKETEDAISAIASTIVVNTPIDNIKEIRRHGDVINCIVKDPTLTHKPIMLNKQQYLKLLTNEA